MILFHSARLIHLCFGCQSSCLALTLLLNLFGTFAVAETQNSTKSSTIACNTIDGLEAFWLSVDRRPAGMSFSDFKAELGCVSLPADTPVIPLQETAGALVSVKVKVNLGDQLYEAWLTESDIRTSY